MYVYIHIILHRHIVFSLAVPRGVRLKSGYAILICGLTF